MRIIAIERSDFIIAGTYLLYLEIYLAVKLEYDIVQRNHAKDDRSPTIILNPSAYDIL